MNRGQEARIENKVVTVDINCDDGDMSSALFKIPIFLSEHCPITVQPPYSR